MFGKSERIDDLVDVLSQQYFLEQVSLEFNKSRQFYKNLSLLFVEIDKFSQIEQDYSLEFGRIILKEILTLIKSNIKTMDSIGFFPGPKKISLLLLNISKDNAIKVAEKLRKSPETKDIPVIFLTALISRREEESGHLVGGNVIFAKPFDTEALLIQIKDLLQKKNCLIKNC